MALHFTAAGRFVKTSQHLEPALDASIVPRTAAINALQGNVYPFLRAWLGGVLRFMNRLNAFLVLPAALLCAGCRTPATHPQVDLGEYPIGLYGVNNTNDFASVRAAGFNVVVGPATRAIMDSAQACGLRVLASPGTSAGPAFDADRARHTVASLGAHPALWAWYLVDEPDFNLVSPNQVRSAQSFVKSLCPGKPTALVLFQGYQARYFANIADITMVDRYPVPWLPLANFGQHVEMARLALPSPKPLIAVIQAFDWSASPEMLPGEKNLRPPTYEELRCMTYEALARGANGLFYFAYDTGRWKLREHPDTWAALKEVVAEVNERLPLFQAELVWWPKEHDFGDPAQRFNEALQSSVTSCLLRVRSGNHSITAGDYVLAVNNTDRNLAYRFTLPPNRNVKDGPVAIVPVVGESRAVAPQQNWLGDDFAPYAVHIYGPLK